MSAELLRQVRRVEAQADKGFDGSVAERAERRRRLRLEVLRQHLTSNVDFLRAAHLGGASGQQSVAAYAGFMDIFLGTLYRLAVEDAKREGLVPSPLVLVALGAFIRARIPETPVFEATELFARGVGESTDVVQKEMYTFDDGGGRSLTLRPEGTAPIARAYIEHGMHREPQPVKAYTIAPMYRYGAPGKGNTLLNYCGIRGDFLDFTVDRNPHKQGRFLPGTHVAIGAPEDVDKARPDFVLILPWNLKDEIMQQLGHVRDWGGKFIVPIPEAKVYD